MQSILHFKKLLLYSILPHLWRLNYLIIDMGKSESSQSHANRAQSADSSKACRKPTAFKKQSTCNHRERGCLPSTVHAQQSETLAARDAERQFVNSQHLTLGGSMCSGLTRRHRHADRSYNGTAFFCHHHHPHKQRPRFYFADFRYF